MFWDRIAGVYDLFAGVVNRKTCTELKTAVAAMIGPDDEVLECACGTGLLTGVIAEKCRMLTATDYSLNMLEQAEKKHGAYGNITFQQGNILALNYPDASFDVVVAANVIHLLEDPGRALREVERVCRRGGRMIIPTYMNQNKKGQTNAFARAVGMASQVFKHHFTMATYQRFFEEAGFSDAEYRLIGGRIPCAVAVITKQ